MEPNSAKLKLTIAKLIELAYSTDKGWSTRIVLSKGPFRLSVNENGQAVLSGKAGSMTFSGSTALEKIALSFKAVNVSFSTDSDGKVRYMAVYDLRTGSVGISGRIDMEALITACSGMLCEAARALKGLNQTQERQLQEIIGH